MSKIKFVLPMLAFVLAIGMSFAFTSATEEDFYAEGYIQVPGGWATISIDCPDGNRNCLVKYNDNATPFTVYNSKNTSDQAKGTGLAEVRDLPTPIAD